MVEEAEVNNGNAGVKRNPMIQNKRDLGGIRTADGRMIKPGLLVRSAHLFQAETRDLEGISTIIDLRTPGERKAVPDQTWGREYLPLPVFDDVTAGISHESGAQDWGIPDMAYLYGRLMRECTGPFRTILLTIMRHDFSTGAVLWHCSEGKDRCGMTTALILEVLGVPRETILADYLKTNLVNMPKAISIRDRLLVTQGKEYADSVYQAYIADERYLRAAWDAMGEDYIQKALLIPEETIRQFTNCMLTAERYPQH